MILKLIAQLLPLLVQVESGGDAKAVGDQGRAVGILQIHKCVVDDVNHIWKMNFTYKDRLDPRKSRRICSLYLRHYMIYLPKDKQTLESLARMWNGGPLGPYKDKTKKYWNKIKRLETKNAKM